MYTCRLLCNALHIVRLKGKGMDAPRNEHRTLGKRRIERKDVVQVVDQICARDTHHRLRVSLSGDPGKGPYDSSLRALECTLNTVPLKFGAAFGRALGRCRAREGPLSEGCSGVAFFGLQLPQGFVSPPSWGWPPKFPNRHLSPPFQARVVCPALLALPSKPWQLMISSVASIRAWPFTLHPEGRHVHMLIHCSCSYFTNI